MPPADDQSYYSELEAGARYLADGAATVDEAKVHRAKAEGYARRQAATAAWER